MALDFITGAEDLVKTIVDKVAPDANLETQGKITQALQELNNAYALQAAQIGTNTEEAKNASLFVAGWRPAVGWICAGGLAYVSIIEPLARFIAVVIFAYTGTFPVISTEITLQVLLGMLGLAGMRSFDKKNGVTK